MIKRKQRVPMRDLRKQTLPARELLIWCPLNSFGVPLDDLLAGRQAVRLKDKVGIVVGAGHTPGDTNGNGRAALGASLA